MNANQNPEQIARDKIDAMLMASGSGCVIQSKSKIISLKGLQIANTEVTNPNE